MEKSNEFCVVFGGGGEVGWRICFCSEKNKDLQFSIGRDGSCSQMFASNARLGGQKAGFF